MITLRKERCCLRSSTARRRGPSVPRVTSGGQKTGFANRRCAWRSSQELNFTADHHRAENAPFPPVAGLLTRAPCEGWRKRYRDSPDLGEPGIRDRECRKCCRTPYVGVYCRRCPGRILALQLRLGTGYIYSSKLVAPPYTSVTCPQWSYHLPCRSGQHLRLPH